MIERWLARVHPRLKRLPAVAPSSPSIQRVTAFPRARSEMLARAAARRRWEAAYDDVRRRHAEGHSLRRINRETGLARATVRKYAFAASFPRNGMREPKLSMLDPFSGICMAASMRAARTLRSSGANFRGSALPAPRSKCIAGCPSGAQARPK